VKITVIWVAVMGMGEPDFIVICAITSLGPGGGGHGAVLISNGPTAGTWTQVVRDSISA